MVIDAHPTSQNAKLTILKLEERTSQMVREQGNWRDPTSAAEDLALMYAFELATLERNSSSEGSGMSPHHPRPRILTDSTGAVETFRKTLKVQCGKSTLKDRLMTCFCSSPTFEPYTAGLDVPIPPFRATLDSWIHLEFPTCDEDVLIGTNRLTKSSVLPTAKKMLNELKPISLCNNDPRANSKEYRKRSIRVESYAELREFIGSKLQELKLPRLKKLASFWVWALRTGQRTDDFSLRDWWQRNIPFNKDKAPNRPLAAISKRGKQTHFRVDTSA